MKKTASLVLLLFVLLGSFSQAALTADLSIPFEDVESTSWFYEDVAYVNENGLMTGTGQTTFSPFGAMSRGMLITVLYRIAGEPEVTAACPFRDVKPGSYYEQPIIWASASGVVNGVSETEYAPDQSATREQIVTILHRFARYSGFAVDSSAELTAFRDSDRVSSYAVDAMKWAISLGIISGTDEKKLEPQGTAQRAQVAAIIHRYAVNVLNGDKINVSVPEPTPQGETPSGSGQIVTPPETTPDTELTVVLPEGSTEPGQTDAPSEGQVVTPPEEGKPSEGTDAPAGSQTVTPPEEGEPAEGTDAPAGGQTVTPPEEGEPSEETDAPSEGGPSDGQTVVPPEPAPSDESGAPEQTVTGPAFVVSQASAQPGQNGVTVTISIQNNPGLASIGMRVRYSDQLILRSLEFNPDIPGEHMEPQTLSSPVKLVWVSPFEDVRGDWTFVTLVFDVPESAAPGAQEIMITYDPDDVYDMTEVNIPFEIINGEINVK